MGHLGPKRGQNEVLGHFLAQNASVFADFAYFDWELWYLVASGGQSAEKKFVGPKMGPIGAKKWPKEVLGHFYFQDSFVLADFAYYAWE